MTITIGAPGAAHAVAPHAPARTVLRHAARHWLLWALLVLGCGSACAREADDSKTGEAAPDHAARVYVDRADVAAFIATMVAEHDFNAGELESLLAQAERKQSILDAIARPAERTLEWHEYRKIFVTDTRLAQGLTFWTQHAATLERAAAEYRVAPEYIVAIIGVETRYGRHMGSYRVLDALATLGFDYPPRADFFRSELQQFLLLVREEGTNPLELLGSYAGAMGYGQFISSSLRAYAVDFDGDGLRDLLHNPVDAIGSVANYFKRHGWRGDARVAAQVTIAPQAAALANPGLELSHTVGELRSAGVAVPADVPHTARAKLLELRGPHGKEHWLALNDFYAITRYNHSDLYALAVHQLAQALRTASESDSS